MMDASYLKLLRRAIDQYQMIQKGDRILVGVSGGKDSSLLFYGLHQLSKWKIYDFEVVGLTVDHGMLGHMEAFDVYCHQEGLRREIHTEHYAVNLKEASAFAPCYTCSRLRKGIIKRYAIENGFNKIALGHTKDDIVETFMMNIIQHGKIATMKPVSEDESGVVMIRPLMLMDEVTIKRLVNQMEIPLMEDLCEFSRGKVRSQSEKLIQEIELTVPSFSDKVVKALSNVDTDRLL